MRAIIAGGGVGGMAAAVALRQIGIEPLVLEQAEALTEIGAGINLWPNAMRALHQLGAADYIRATEAMFRQVFASIRAELDRSGQPVA